MKLKIISFTKKGITLSLKIKEKASGLEVLLYTKKQAETKANREQPENGQQGIPEVTFVSESISSWTKKQMEEKQAILFIGACGIAVRSTAPNLTDKLQDGPVLVMDELGKYVIPILSGHIGGANEIAKILAKEMGAEAVITTATDVNGTFAVDLFAKRNHLLITKKEGIVKVSSKVLEGKSITICVETGHIRETDNLASFLQRVSYPPVQPVDILITSKEKKFESNILLRPKEYVIGMGCKKGKEEKKIEEFVKKTLTTLGLSLQQIYALTSIQEKENEPGLLAWTEKHKIPFFTYSVKELEEVKGIFQESKFVKDTVGIGNVCERSALKACGTGGKMVYKKHTLDGMTIAIAKREWSVTFDEV